MRTLLIFTCAQDLCLTRNLLIRIGQLRAWERFSRLLLRLDNDLTEEEAELFLRPFVPLPASAITFSRSTEFNVWNTDRTAASLAGYQLACSFEQDFVRIDPDLFIRSPEFVDHLLRETPGVAGRVMPFFLPAKVAGSQLTFVQGGAIYCGEEARRWLQTLRAGEIARVRRNYDEYVSDIDEGKREVYDYFFRSTEDVIIFGLLATLHGVPRRHIPNLQLSPYDVLTGYKLPHRTPVDYITAFELSPAMAYHFEGGHEGRKQLMTKMLKWTYDNYDEVLTTCRV